jgi:hypothetical protein
VPVDDVRRFEDEFLDYLQRSHEGVYASIRETRELNDDTATRLKDAIEEFRGQFEVSGGGTLGTDRDERDGEGDREGDSDPAREGGRDGDRGHARDGDGDGGGDEPAEPMDEDRVEREKVTRRLPPAPPAQD